MNLVSRYFPGYRKMVSNEYILNKKYYQEYNQNVINYFNKNSKNFLILNLEDPEKMNKLGDFLNKKVDDVKYPNEREIILHFKQCIKNFLWIYLI